MSPARVHASGPSERPRCRRQQTRHHCQVMSSAPNDLLADRLVRHAEWLRKGGRSPLYWELMLGAAASARAGGVVAAVFAEDDLAPGSVPALRLLAVVHFLVLSDRAPELAAYFPSAGGTLSPVGAWAAAERAINANFEEVRERARRPVQTNEPGRCTALYGALLWLAERHRMPVRLLELGASAGLNLIPDRYAYQVSGAWLGRPGSGVRFVEPWVGSPVPDPSAASALLSVRERRGCDPAPLDLRTAEGRLTAMSYIWPDETERLARLGRAIDEWLAEPVAVEREVASRWLAGGAADPREGNVTVVWQSVVRQYLPEPEARGVVDALRHAAAGAAPQAPLAWVTLEPGEQDHLADFWLGCTVWPPGEHVVLASVEAHGSSVRWMR